MLTVQERMPFLDGAWRRVHRQHWQARERDPGRCFLRAGWTYLRTTNGAAKGRADLLVLRAPEAP